MGTYATQCVLANRNNLCDALNTPCQKIPIRDSASLDDIIPPRSLLGKEDWQARYREAIRTRRDGRMPGFSGADMFFSPSVIKTFLLHPDYMYSVFEPYCVGSISKSINGLRFRQGQTGRANFPVDLDDFQVIRLFLGSENGFERRRYGDDTIKPWHATDEEIQLFRRRLAGFLLTGSKGSQMSDEEIPTFMETYQNSVAYSSRRP